MRIFRKKPVYQERNDQIYLVNWFHDNYPNEILTICPTFKIGGLTQVQRIIQWKYIKAMGYLKDTPDLLIFAVRHKYHGLLIELKKEGGRKDPEQEALHKRFIDKGYFATTCIGYQEAVSAITNYMGKSNLIRHEIEII